MANAKEKAIELVSKFSTIGLQQRNEGIACALIAVDEIIKVIPMYTGNLNETWRFWQEVKQEINNL